MPPKRFNGEDGSASKRQASGSKSHAAERQTTLSFKAIKKENKPKWWKDIKKLEDIDDARVSRIYKLHKVPCSRSDHSRKKNCENNPLCLYGLGEKRFLAKDAEEKVGQLANLSRGETPMGLRNLGATCYMNSLLQSLFMNRTFRRGLFSYRSLPGADDAVLLELQRLFVSLTGPAKVHNPKHFVDALGIDHGVQQDPQEFNSLLLRKLEDTLSHTKMPELKNLISRMFEGELEYVIQCSKCQKTSRRAESFVEIVLGVKGGSIANCVNDWASPEILDGENQYACPQCGPSNAVRTLSLKKLPPILNFQLARFRFDPKTLNKKKVKTPVHCPVRLDLSKVLEVPDGSVYTLSAVLLHKGFSAYGGHYVAYVRDQNTKKWWRFDDETVTQENPGGKDSEETKTGDVYMVIYRRGSDDKEPPLPDHLRGVLEKAREEMQKAQADQDAVRAEALDQWHTSRALYKAFIEEPGPPEVWIDKDWLERWITGPDVPKADGVEVLPNNGPLRCPHGRMSPERVSDAKLISRPAWEYFSHNTPEGIVEGLCNICAWENIKLRGASEIKNHWAARIRKGLDGMSGVWVSRAWMKKWINSDTMPELSHIITDIVCDHGHLTTRKELRQIVPSDFWAWVIAGYEDEFPPAFAKDAPVCAQCQEAAAEVQEAEKAAKKENQNERKSAPSVYGGISSGDLLLAESWRRRWLEQLDGGRAAGPIDNSVLLCPHERLIYDPQEIYDSDEEPPQLQVHEDEWEFLAGKYGGGPQVSVETEVCDDCAQSAREMRQRERLLYENASISIQLTGRTGRPRGSALVIPGISSNTPVINLKYMITGETDLDPAKQRLSYNGVTLRQGCLADYKVPKGGKLLCEQAADEDADFVDADFGARGPGVEKGFQGSALTGSKARKVSGWVCPVCTLKNNLDALACEACLTERPH